MEYLNSGNNNRKRWQVSTHLLSQIKNFQDCSVGYPAQLEVDAAVDAVISIWADSGQHIFLYRMYAETGSLELEDLDLINEVIRDHKLSCTVGEVEQQLIRECEERTGT